MRQVSFIGKPLSPRRYLARAGALPDDGIVDAVKVARRLSGEPVQLTNRERYAAVILGTRRGMTAPDLDALLGMRDKYASKVRQVVGIQVEPELPRYRPAVNYQTRRTAAGWRRESLSGAMPLIYGLSNPHSSHRASDYEH